MISVFICFTGVEKLGLSKRLPCPVAGYDGREFLYGFWKRVIDHNMLVMSLVFHFVFSGF
jgi:hypothetical protein